MHSQLQKRIAITSHEKDPAQHISHHAAIERQSWWYSVDESYPNLQLAYFRLHRRDCGQVFLCSGWKFRHTSDPMRSAVWWCQIWHRMHILLNRPILTSHQELLTYDPSPGTSLNHVCPHHSTLEQFILLNLKDNFFLPECFQSVAASAHRVSSVRH